MAETPCGLTHSKNSGKPFTAASMAQHVRDCPACNGQIETYESLGLGMTELLAGDESDGVFWAMAWELGEW